MWRVVHLDLIGLVVALLDPVPPIRWASPHSLVIWGDDTAECRVARVARRAVPLHGGVVVDDTAAGRRVPGPARCVVRDRKSALTQSFGRGRGDWWGGIGCSLLSFHFSDPGRRAGWVDIRR
jgi:hypothetical protein